MFSLSASGSFKSTEDYLTKLRDLQIEAILESCGQDGVTALSNATPYDTGLAAGSWSYKVEKSSGGYSISWSNSDVESGFPVSIMLQYGYSTGTGGYVAGRDYINPAMAPVFDKIAEKMWKAVTSA